MSRNELGNKGDKKCKPIAAEKREYGSFGEVEGSIPAFLTFALHSSAIRPSLDRQYKGSTRGPDVSHPFSRDHKTDGRIPHVAPWFPMSQVLIVIVIVYGSVLNLLAKPWSSTESMLERRRNDIIAILLWINLFIIAIQTVRFGVSTASTQNAFDLQDWTALILPFALAAPYLLELVATLVRQLEMWRWMRRASIHALPIAWLYRTMTVGEPDHDGTWIRKRSWAPNHRHLPDYNIMDQSSSFWISTTRKASIYHLFQTWLTVLISATRYSCHRIKENVHNRMFFQCLTVSVTLLITVILTILMSILFALSFFEIALLLSFDIFWWTRCNAQGIILARYETVHFGRQEMQHIFENSLDIKLSLRVHEDLDRDNVHNRIMGAVITTTAVLENAFRRAYLVVPVYEFSMSNRKALRENYAFVGCDLDRLIKQVRVLLEMRHTSGLLSITSSSGTIEASLHNNIESILSIAMFFSSAVLYHITARIADIECIIEERISHDHSLSAESITRERVVYIDARNAMFWLLWIVVTEEWNDPAAFWAMTPCDTMNAEEVRKVRAQFPDTRTEALYVIATFLSRCRYCDRYGFQNEELFYQEVRELGRLHGQEVIEQVFEGLSDALQASRSLSLLDWVAREYKVEWAGDTQRSGGEGLRCKWENDSGAFVEAKCNIVLT